MTQDFLTVSDITDALAGCCQSTRGAREARVLDVCTTAEQAQARHEATDQALHLLAISMPPAVPHHLDLGDSLALCTRSGVLDGEQLRAIGLTLRGGDDVRRAAANWPDQAEELRDVATELPRLSLLATLLCEALDERGLLLDDASAELSRLRAEVRRRSSGLRQRIAAMVKENDADGLLQDDYYTVREGRYVLPVKSSDKRVIDGIVHGSSHTGQTVYMEPREMVEANNALSLASDAVRREERRILAEFSASVGQHSEAIERLCEQLSWLDQVMARARLALDLELTRPILTGLSGGLRLRGLRHPRLLLGGHDVVPNDIEMSAQSRWLIVSGPNGGGKTVLLTAVGLAAEMARRGLHICARDGSCVPFVREVAVVLGDAQDLEAGHSTFSGHLARVSGALKQARSGPALVLLDELASGTEPLAGSALARSILEAFAALPCIGFVATHFEALKLLPLEDEAYANAALELDPGNLRPTFRLRMGASGSSSPLEVAERMGLPADVVTRARQLLGSGSRETEDAVRRLGELQQQAESALAEAERERSIAKESRRRLEEQRQFEKRALDQRVDEAAKGALLDIERARNAAKAARKRLRKPATVAEIDEATAELGSQEKRMTKHRSKPPTDSRRARPPAEASDLVPGAIVMHQGLGVDVEILEISKSGKKIRVKAGVMQMDASPTDLRKPLRPPPPKNKSTESQGHRSAGSAHPAPSPVPTDAFDDEDHTSDFRTGDWTCDLRGMRVEDGIVDVERHLDRAVVSGVRGVCIVHGHGTGAMRKAVTELLRRHKDVLRSRLGGQGEGGAGATMVWMKR